MGLANALNMKIVVGVSCGELFKVDTVRSILGVIKHTSHEVDTVIQQGCWLHENRNLLSRYAVEKEASHILFVDSDMCFPDDTLDRLLEHDKEIVGANYFLRRSPKFSVVKFGNENNIMPASTTPQSLFECFSVGGGLVLVKTWVFAKLTKPLWYHDQYKGELMGEDVYFCRNAHRSGFRVWCDGTLKILHIGDYAY